MSSLAAARADGYYYPPTFDPSKGGLNKVWHHGPGFCALLDCCRAFCIRLLQPCTRAAGLAHA